MASGADVIAAMRRKLTRDEKPPTLTEIARHLGMHSAQLSAFKAEANLTPLKIANLVQRAVAEGEVRAISSPITPVVEFFPIGEVNARGASQRDLFHVTVDGKVHAYRDGLKQALCSASGIYIFYDSRGRALYVGKAKEQTLWNEMKAAFNRDRRDLQLLKRVGHPESSKAFRPSNEQHRQIVERSVPLSTLASYFSAYQVPTGLIDEMEAFLIRGFANDLLNKKMETFNKAAKRAAKSTN